MTDPGFCDRCGCRRESCQCPAVGALSAEEREALATLRRLREEVPAPFAGQPIPVSFVRTFWLELPVVLDALERLASRDQCGARG